MQLACPPRRGLGIILFGPIKFLQISTQQDGGCQNASMVKVLNLAQGGRIKLMQDDFDERTRLGEPNLR